MHTPGNVAHHSRSLCLSAQSRWGERDLGTQAPVISWSHRFFSLRGHGLQMVEGERECVETPPSS